MFQNWDFLIGEMVVLLILAALVGLLAGWIIWGRRVAAAPEAHETALRDELNTCRAAGADQAARIAQLEGELEAARDALVFTDPNAEVGTRPVMLDAARDGRPDDLKQIKGVGPKLETLCNTLGFFHFDQIANWTPEEVAWVDENLEGFKGRVSRDGWVAQAKVLAAGGTTDFSEKVKKGEVY